MNKNTLFSIAEKITPPIIFNAFRKSFLYDVAKKASSYVVKDKYNPTWHTISKGRLEGTKLFVDPQGDWQREMLEGSYDDFFFNYVEKLDLKGKVIFDIGTHVGYNSLYFADMVGENGKVYAFEPNTFNQERFEMIMKENPRLGDRIVLKKVAISNKIGHEDFVFSPLIENGTSSGSFLDSSHTHGEKTAYETKGGWKRVSVPTVSLDEVHTIGISEKPYLIKLDIEGAEYLALEGARKLLKEAKPIILIEIHSIFNMMKALEIFNELNYNVSLLKEEKDGRCFLTVTPK